MIFGRKTLITFVHWPKNPIRSTVCTTEARQMVRSLLGAMMEFSELFATRLLGEWSRSGPVCDCQIPILNGDDRKMCVYHLKNPLKLCEQCAAKQCRCLPAGACTRSHRARLHTRAHTDTTVLSDGAGAWQTERRQRQRYDVVAWMRCRLRAVCVGLTLGRSR